MLTIDGVTVRLGGRPILERASASIPQGARVGLIGRNGAGKSTLMKTIIGEIEPDEGQISRPSRSRPGEIRQVQPGPGRESHGHAPGAPDRDRPGDV